MVTMSKAIRPEDSESEIERDILRAFGWAIVEFEETLYRKYVVMSAPHSLMPRDEFNRHLLRMHARGHVTPLKLHGCKAWKKLVIEDRIEDTLRPRKIEMAKEPIPPRPEPKRFVVSDSHIIAQDIAKTMRSKLFPGRQDDEHVKNTVRQHASQLRRALTESRRSFIDYLDRKAPTLKEPMQLILSSKGEEILLLSLRLIETGAIER